MGKRIKKNRRTLIKIEPKQDKVHHIGSINVINARYQLIDWGRMTHACVSKLTIIGSYNGLSLARRQAIIWTSVGILLICPLGTNVRHSYFFKINGLENIEILVILSRPQCLKSRFDKGANLVLPKSSTIHVSSRTKATVSIFKI